LVPVELAADQSCGTVVPSVAVATEESSGSGVAFSPLFRFSRCPWIPQVTVQV